MSVNLNSVFIDKLHSIHWFSNCEPSVPKTTVIQAINKASWENIVLEERGHFTAELSKNHREIYKDWNRLAQQFKAEVLPTLHTTWQEKLQAYDLNEPSIILDVSSNVLIIALLNAYEPYVPFPSFFSELFAIYNNGQLPYGWKDSQSDGKFLIY